MDTRDHWENVYTTKGSDDVSWFQRLPATSIRLITSVSTPADAVVDVGAGTSTLVDELLSLGYDDLTIVDVSAAAVHEVSERLAERAQKVTRVIADITEWEPSRTFAVWHDRAVLHFMTNDSARSAYVTTVARSLAQGGHLIVATFSQDGPDTCSGMTVTRYDADDLFALFGRWFERVAAEREVHVTPWGTEQPFTWVVLRRNTIPA